ncbi:hypothetical protein BGM19_07800 [Streptomyces agglomeratus]|uniref:hypothetical protein n=1 Tax=Streptomyces agglomeratus TaxID=285458 RepID=UPI00086A44D1|nr:hypothetical protein [Streptomyces agglomeratus]OEJ57882.1 hypothetical protein BGM19_07800 [Streptomyces agglomeratus]
MSVQDLLNLIAPRSGEVDPASCLQCASLRKQVTAATKSGIPADAEKAVNAMRAHKQYGHPEDSRALFHDLPDSAPRVI